MDSNAEIPPSTGSGARSPADPDFGELGGRRRTVSSSGAQLAVFEFGRTPAPGVPALLLVHGYPDDHRVFLPVIRRLASTFTIVTYDTRVAGQSVAGGGPGAFLLSTLVDDLFAVIETTGLAQVHLVGHDWGSIQAWAALRDPRAGVFSRFTSVSGPDLLHFRRWIRGSARRPGSWPRLAGQLLRSSYVAAFQLPLLPEAVWRRYLGPRYEDLSGRSIGENPARGLVLYRRTLFSARRAPGRINVPVHVVVPLRDPFLSPSLTAGLEEQVSELTVEHVEGGHWWIAARPADFAAVLDAGPHTNGT